MKIVELKIDDSIISGFDATALVESPAIEENFIAFNKVSMAEMTYNDYPQAAVDAAKRGIELNKENNMKCATQVGKVRAQQLVNGEKLSLDTIQRMRSFLIRQKGNFELATRRKDYNACGYISYLLWGGEAALPWAEKKLRQAGIEFSAYAVYNNEGMLEEYAEVGERGGIKASPKAPKSDTPNPNPKGKGTAKGDAGTTRGAEVDKATEESLQKKADEFNEKYKDKLGYGANIGALKSVYQRGLGAYNTSRSPSVAAAGGAKQWAMARVNAYLYLLKNGRPQNKKYTTDYDLLPAKHPKKDEFDSIIEDVIKDYLIADLLGLDDEDFAIGVPHYTKDGKLYEGPTHKDASGKLMTGAVHTDDSEFLYHADELLEQFNINVAALPNFINEASTGGKKRNFAAELADKQMLVGPLMTPGKLIPRKDEETGEEYQVFFSAETIEKIAYKMMQDKLLDSVNIEHDGAVKVDDAYLVETWIVKDPEHDKSTLYGFQPMTGQWFGIYRIGDGRVWNEYVKTGKVKGFSVEGYFYNNVLTKK